MNFVNVKRKTKESDINVSLDFSPLSPDYKEGINTTETFLNHMIEHIAYRWGVNIKAEYTADIYDLKHLIFEDIGMALGKAIGEYVIDSYDKGIRGFGSAVGIIDEAKAEADISFEGRSYFLFDSDCDIPSETEGTLSEDLKTFLDGMCQGGRFTLHIKVVRGENGHHIWEAVYRALGTALYEATKIYKEREALTAGVCGKVEYEITKG